MPYRTDASAIARERARRLAKLRHLEAVFTDVFWRELASRFELARSSARDWAKSDEIAADIAELDERITAIESLLGRWSSVERLWRRPAGRAPIGPGSDRAHVGNETLDTAIAREQLARWIDAARPRIPVDARVRPSGVGVAWALATSAPRGAGTLTVEPERLLDDLRKMAGVLTDIEVGDERFDGVFLVQGHEATARAILTPPMRRVLLRMGARRSRLRVELAGGSASIAMVGAPERDLVEDALEVLARLRRAPVRALRRDP